MLSSAGGWSFSQPDLIMFRSSTPAREVDTEMPM